MAKATVERVQEFLDDDPSLGTLKNQFSAAEVFEKLEDVEGEVSDDALYDALMAVMYATRPVGYL